LTLVGFWYIINIDYSTLDVRGDPMDRQLLLLGLLRVQEMHGYQLNEFIDSQMYFCVDLKRSTAYYVLDKLCRDGYVTEEIEREGNRPERKVYRISASGEAYFQQLLRENLARYEPPTYAHDIGATFIDHIAPDEQLALLEQRHAALLTHRARLEALRSELPESHRLVVDHHLLHLDAEQHWNEQLIARAHDRSTG
jgi:DNA-binding PadR family transcriptional regulator